MSRDALDQLRRDAEAERHHRPDAGTLPPRGEYPLDLVNHNTGRLETWWFPVVREPDDTATNQAQRRRLLEAAAVRMTRGLR